MNELYSGYNCCTRHFSNTGKISSKAKRIIHNAEDGGNDKLFISVVSLFEIVYLHERDRISVSLPTIISHLEVRPCYEVIDLSMPIVSVANSISFYEMHDRLILATAIYLKSPVISSDERFDEVSQIKRIW